MEIYKSHYWKLTVILQKSIGYWAFEGKRKSYAIWSFLYIILFSIIISMGIRLYIEIGINVNIVIENTMFEIYLSVISVKVTASIILKKKFEILYAQIANDWKTIINKNELKVMHEYAEVGRKTAITYTGFMVFFIAIFLGLPLFTPLLDYIVPIENETRSKTLPIYAEFGIDQQKYFYTFVIIIMIQGFITVALLITFDMGYMMIVQHVVGLFALVKYRLDKVAETSKSIENYIVDFPEGDRIAFHYAVDAIDLHQIVIRYVGQIESCYSFCWFYILTANIILFGAALSLIFMKDSLIEQLRYTAGMIACSVHFYYIFLPGQKVINISLEVFDSCYSCKWYNLSGKSKSLLKIMMIRSLRPCQFTGGNMFLMCMDTYSNMMKTGFSIFTLLR